MHGPRYNFDLHGLAGTRFANRNPYSTSMIPLVFMAMYDGAMRKITLIAMMMAAACGGPVAEEAPVAEMAVSPQQIEQDHGIQSPGNREL